MQNHHRLGSLFRAKCAGYCRLIILAAGMMLCGCSMAASGDMAKDHIPLHTKGTMIQPNMGLKKITYSKISVPGRNLSPEQRSMLVANCLFNAATAVTAANLEACLQDDVSDKFSTAVVKSAVSDSAGNHHVRINQRYRGLRVVGAEIIVHLNSAGAVYRINGVCLPLMDIHTQPAIDKETALSIGFKQVGDGDDATVDQAPELVIFAKRLAYHYVISHTGENGGQWHFYVDASTGDLMFRYNNRQTGG